MASERAQLHEARGQRLAEFDVERIGLAVRQRQHGDAVHRLLMSIMRACHRRRAATAQAVARCDSRSACTTAMVNTTIASDLMRERQRERRLIAAA